MKTGTPRKRIMSATVNLYERGKLADTNFFAMAQKEVSAMDFQVLHDFE